MPTKEKKPIINAHAHIFTGFFVPPYLARTFLVDPLYRLVNTKWIIDAFRRHYKKQFKKIYARSDKEDDYENALETKELRAEKSTYQNLQQSFATTLDEFRSKSKSKFKLLLNLNLQLG